MAALETVQDYITAARSLLQDTVDSPYRYSNADLVAALNYAVSEASRLRPDFFIDIDVPFFVVGSLSDEVGFTPAYVLPLLMFVVGFVQLRDAEDTQDARAVGFMGKFSQALLALG